MGGFDRQFAKAGQERGERCNIPGGPAGARHIARAKGKDEQNAGHRDDPVQRRHGGHRQPSFDGGTLVILQAGFIRGIALRLTAIHAVGQRAGHPVQCGGAQAACALLVGSAGALHQGFHLLGNIIGDRRKHQAEQRQPPVVPQQHHGIGQQGNAGIKNFRGELAHALGTGVHIGNSFGHQGAGTGLFQLNLVFPHQIGVQYLFHAAVDVVGKLAHIQPLDEP